jgi:hypothetical protein
MPPAPGHPALTSTGPATITLKPCSSNPYANAGRVLLIPTISRRKRPKVHLFGASAFAQPNRLLSNQKVSRLDGISGPSHAERSSPGSQARGSLTWRFQALRVRQIAAAWSRLDTRQQQQWYGGTGGSSRLLAGAGLALLPSLGQTRRWTDG